MSFQLQQTRYDQLIRRAGGLIGGGSKVSSVIPELFPVLELEDTTPELLALSGWRIAWQSTERPALVANTSASQLFNPPGSGAIIAVTLINFRADATSGFIQAQIVDVAIGTPIKGLFRDARFGVPRNTVGEVRSADGVATGGGLRYRLEVGVKEVRDDNGIVVLTPGTGLQVGTTLGNLQLTVNYFWRERVAEASELSFP